MMETRLNRSAVGAEERKPEIDLALEGLIKAISAIETSINRLEAIVTKPDCANEIKAENRANTTINDYISAAVDDLNSRNDRLGEIIMALEAKIGKHKIF